MRGIKFRAWHPKQQRMFRVNFIDFDFKKIGCILIDHTINFDFEEIILMQSIGLLDCKGNEIYDGDILKFDDSEIGGPKDIGVVEWWEDFTLVRNPGWYIWIKHQGIENRQFPFNREIIGNIYENKDLLK